MQFWHKYGTSENMGRLYKRGSRWYADYEDRLGKRRRKCTRVSDKQVAAKILAKWETEEVLVSEGLKADASDYVPIEKLLKRYRSSLVSSGKSEQHVRRTVQLAREVADYNRWQHISEISAGGLADYCEHLMERFDRAHRTVDSAITAVRAFCRWCVREKVLGADPTATLKKPSADTDRRIERRMLLPEEWAWLVKSLTGDLVRNGQPASERLLMYRFAIETGMRSSELRSRTKADLKLKHAEPHVIAKARITKNAKLAKQYLSDDLSRQLKAFVAGKSPGSLVFNVESRTEMARTLRKDVSDARELWLADDPKNDACSDFLRSPNSQGEVLDFHALRHTCGGWLVMQGVTLTEVKEIMRHSTIKLTANTYGHLAPDARSRSRNVLSSMLGEGDGSKGN